MASFADVAQGNTFLAYGRAGACRAPAAPVGNTRILYLSHLNMPSRLLLVNQRKSTFIA
jgi:hypothetical protein